MRAIGSREPLISDGLEMFPQFSEAADDEQLLSAGSGIHLLMLKNPGIAMRNEHGIEPGSEGRIDIRLRAVADHPCAGVITVVSFSNLRIHICFFLGHDLRCRKELLDARALYFSGLLSGCAFGYQN